ncbi:autotransporter domain-containing protein [Acetobacter fabarum]|uniref:autotransporter domain-containing protein n=1 Tax=Acetobacter fabarum TaxID=483199 RepID=UPI00312B8710
MVDVLRNRKHPVASYCGVAKIGFLATLLCGAAAQAFSPAYAQSADPNTVTFSPSGTASSSAIIADNASGPVSILMNGAVMQSVSGVNTYTGATTISNGTLALIGSGSIASSAGVHDNATLDISGSTQSSVSIQSLDGTGNIVTGSTPNIYSPDVTITDGNSTFGNTFSGTISGSGGLLVSGGSETLSGGNTYTGSTGVSSGAMLTVSGGGSLDNTNNIKNDGTVVLDHADITVPDNTGANWTGVIATGFDSGSTANMTLRNGSTIHSAGGTLTAGFGPGSSGTVTVDNSSITESVVVAGEHGTGVISVRNGSSVTANLVALGNQATGSGHLDVTGAGSQLNIGSYGLYVNADGSGTVSIQDGGTISSVGPVSFGDGSTVASGSTGTLSIAQGGTLAVGGTNGIVDNEGSAGNYEFVLQGGTLKNTGSDLTSAVNITLLNGSNSTVDTNGLNTTLSGVLSGESASLTKAGSGTLLLSGQNTYTGTTDVNAGTLQVDGSTGTGDTTVASGATLSGTGTIGGSATIASGATLSAGDGVTGIGTLTIARDLTLENGSIQNFQIGAASTSGGHYNDLVHVGGNLTLGGLLNVAADSAGPDAQSGNLAAGVYRLYTYDGSLSGAMNETLGTIEATQGMTLGVQTSIAHQVNLVVNDGSLTFWDGSANGAGVSSGGSPDNNVVDGGNGVWTAMNGMGDNNWTNASGNHNAPWYTGGYAIFEGSAGTVTVLDRNAGGSAAPVMINSMQFINNDGRTYVITGDDLYATTARTTVNVGDGTSAGAAITARLDTVINDQNVQGGTSLVKTNAGTLVVTKDQTYRGATVIEGGTLQLGNGGTAGGAQASAAIHDNGNLAVNRSDMVTLGQVIDGTGRVTQAGAGQTTLAGVNTYTGGTVITGGSLVGTTSSFGSGRIVDGAALEVAQDTSGVLENPLSGNGSFTKSGTGVVGIEGDDSAFTGTTDIRGGTLDVGGSLASSAVNVSNGSTLAGTGTVGNTQIAAGGILAPAGSGQTGSMTVNGNLVMTAGSTLAIDTTGTPTGASLSMNGQSYQQMGSDLVKVMGAVTLSGGTVRLNVAGAPTLQYDQAYQIVSSAKGVSGRYDGLTTNLGNTYTFLTPSLVYGTESVDIMQTRNTVTFASVGNSRNEKAIGWALDSLPADTPVVGAVSQLGLRGARAAFNALSGEVHASARTALIQDSFFVRQAALDRLDNAGCDKASADGTIRTADLRTQRDDGCHTDRAMLWGEAYGSLGHNTGDGNAATMQHSTAGFVMGADAPVMQTWRVGGLVSYGRSMFDIGGGRASSGHSNNVSVGGYAGTHWGHLNLRLGATYTWDMLSASRTTAVPGLGQRLSSNYLGGTAQGFGELSYRLHAGKSIVEPFGNVAYVNLHTNNYHEHGSAGAVNGKTTDTGVTFSTFGLRVSSAVRAGKLLLVPHGMLAYRHAFGLTVPTQHQNFASMGGAGMDIAGVGLSTNAAVLDTGLTARLTDRIDVGLSYIGQYGNHSVDSGAKAHIRFQF